MAVYDGLMDAGEWLVNAPGDAIDALSPPDPTAARVAAAAVARMQAASPFLGNAEVERTSTPEKPYLDAMQGISLDQGDLYSTMISRGQMFDPGENAATLRDAAGWYDSQMGDQSAGLDAIAAEALSGRLESPRASELAMRRATAAARGAAASGRGDAAVMLREADFIQGAANRYAREQARADALVESDARRGVAGDATMAAAGLEDAAAKVAAASEEAASGIEVEGAKTKADALEGATRGWAGDVGAMSDLAIAGSDLEGRGMDTREDIGNTMFETDAGIERIGMGSAVRGAERAREETQANWRTGGTITQVSGEAIARSRRKNTNDEDNY